MSSFSTSSSISPARPPPFDRSTWPQPVEPLPAAASADGAPPPAEAAMEPATDGAVGARAAAVDLDVGIPPGLHGHHLWITEVTAGRTIDPAVLLGWHAARDHTDGLAPGDGGQRR